MRPMKLVLAPTLLLVCAPGLAEDAVVIDPPSFTPAANEAVVYIVRPHRVGGAISFFAFVDDIPVGVTRARDYTGAIVPAGRARRMVAQR